MNDKNGNKWKRPIEWQEAGREVPEMLSHVPLKKYKGWNKLDDDVDDGHRVRVVDSLERGKFFPTLNYFGSAVLLFLLSPSSIHPAN